LFHKYAEDYADPTEKRPEMHPDMLLMGTVMCQPQPCKAALVEMLLQRGALLEQVWEGETPLIAAVFAGDVEVKSRHFRRLVSQKKRLKQLVARGMLTESSMRRGFLSIQHATCQAGAGLHAELGVSSHNGELRRGIRLWKRL
jgi:hypothetical protein